MGGAAHRQFEMRIGEGDARDLGAVGGGDPRPDDPGGRAPICWPPTRREKIAPRRRAQKISGFASPIEPVSSPRRLRTASANACQRPRPTFGARPIAWMTSGGDRAGDRHEFGNFSAIDRERALRHRSLKAGVFQAKGEDRPLDKTQVFARRILDALRDDELFDRKAADIGLDPYAEFLAPPERGDARRRSDSVRQSRDARAPGSGISCPRSRIDAFSASNVAASCSTKRSASGEGSIRFGIEIDRQLPGRQLCAKLFVFFFDVGKCIPQRSHRPG